MDNLYASLPLWNPSIPTSPFPVSDDELEWHGLKAMIRSGDFSRQQVDAPAGRNMAAEAATTAPSLYRPKYSIPLIKSVLFTMSLKKLCDDASYAFLNWVGERPTIFLKVLLKCGAWQNPVMAAMVSIGSLE